MANERLYRYKVVSFKVHPRTVPNNANLRNKPSRKIELSLHERKVNWTRPCSTGNYGLLVCKSLIFSYQQLFF